MGIYYDFYSVKHFVRVKSSIIFRTQSSAIFAIYVVMVTPILYTRTRNIWGGHNLRNAKLALSNALDIGTVTLSRFYSHLIFDYILATCTCT
jgi:hypothetical protein